LTSAPDVGARGRRSTARSCVAGDGDRGPGWSGDEIEAEIEREIE
jgi:hypothetical protein